MKRFYDIATRCFRMPALIAGIFLLIAGAVACSEKKAPDVPKEQSDLLFETFRDLEQKNYESALPKLKRYQEIDRTNVLIDHMINQVTTNVYVVQLRSLLEQGNFAEAEKLMRTMLAEHDELEDRVQLKDFASRLNGVDQLIRKLEPVQNSESLRNNAEHLRREAEKVFPAHKRSLRMQNVNSNLLMNWKKLKKTVPTSGHGWMLWMQKTVMIKNAQNSCGSMSQPCIWMDSASRLSGNLHPENKINV